MAATRPSDLRVALPATWLGALPGWVRVPVAGLAGAALTLGQPPVSLPLVVFLALPILAWLLDGVASWRGALALGWAAGFGSFVAGLHWMGHAFLVEPDRFAWLLPFAVTLLPAGLGIFWAAAFALARALADPGPGRWIALAAALAAAEYARSTVLTGLPWGLPAYVWAETPIAQAASLVGPHGLSLATLLAAATALPLLATRRWALALLPATAVVLAAGWGTLRLAEPVPPLAERVALRIVQPNARQDLKWVSPHRERFAERLMALSAAPPDPRLGPPAAVIWPEIAVTFLPQRSPEHMAQIAASAGGAPLVTGALFFAETDRGREWSNALMVVDPAGRIVRRYDKHHLVPFGEYMPLRGLLEGLGLEAIAGMAGAGFVPGPGPRVIRVPGLPPFAPAICYEMIFPQGILPNGLPDGGRPDWILHLTNDAWFGRFAGPQQHLAQARFRAIEQALPVVRAANTGISAVIDARGRVLDALPLGTHGALDAALPPPRPPTPYAATGDWPALGALALLGLGLLAARARAA
ncbi:MAG: apolipoprotein N-acyltransferase [Paracoccaceae bacterium]